MLPKLKSLFHSYHFSLEEIEQIMAHFEVISLKKKSFFLKLGDIADKMAFVEEGAFHYYLYNDGEKITTFILLDCNIITSISSYLQNLPSIESIQAITDTKIAVISKNSINELRIAIPRFQNLYIDAIEQQVICLDGNRTDLLTLTAEQRYLKLLKTQPELLLQIPLKLLASTLGISPRHLTRIRGSIVD